MLRKRRNSHLVRRPVTPYRHPPGIVAVTKACIGIPKSFAHAAYCASNLTRCMRPNRAWALLLVCEVTTCPGPGDHSPEHYRAVRMCN